MKKNDFEKFKKELIKKKVSYDKLGVLMTLKGTDNVFWYAYSGKLDITIKSIKKTDIVIDVWNGKKRITKEMLEFPKRIKIKSCLKWYQNIRIEIMSTIKAIIAVVFNYRKLKQVQKIKWPTKI